MIIGRNVSISPYKNPAVIYNPHAGGLRRGGIAALDRAQGILEQGGAPFWRYKTTGPKTAGAIARECIAQGADLVVAVGGDGTINEVADGMNGSRIPLAILPAGTANVLANEIGLGGRMENAARRLLHCVELRVPLGLLCMNEGASRHFLIMTGAGLDGHIVRYLNPVLKAKLGKLAYWAAGSKEFLRRLEEFEVTVSGQTYRCSFALVSKVRNYGGDFEIASRVRLSDEEFEVVLFEGPNPWRYLIYLTGIAARVVARVPGVRVFRASEVSMRPLKGDTIHLQMDGEYVGQLPARMRVAPDALTLMAPSGYGRK